MGAGAAGVCGTLTQKVDCHAGGVGANGGTDDVALQGSVSLGRSAGVPVAVLTAVLAAVLAAVLPKVGDASEGRRWRQGPCAPSPSSSASFVAGRRPNGNGVLGGCLFHSR